MFFELKMVTIMSKKLIPLIAFLFFYSAAISQTRYLYYFDLDFNLSKKSHAVYYGYGAYENMLFELKVYNFNNDGLRLIEHFKDSTLQISQGLFASYYYDNLKESEGNYVNGNPDGIWKRWNESGKIIDSTVYQNVVKVFEKKFEYDKKRLLIETIVDSMNNLSNTVGYFDSKGNLLLPNQTSELKDSTVIYRKPQISPSFPGGAEEWVRYISRKIMINVEKFKKNDNGTCLIQFVVDTNGNVTNVKAVTMPDSRLAKVAIEAILKGPKWIPAEDNGSKVNAYRIQPVSFESIE